MFAAWRNDLELVDHFANFVWEFLCPYRPEAVTTV
jgi:hypothetical protein